MLDEGGLEPWGCGLLQVFACCFGGPEGAVVAVGRGSSKIGMSCPHCWAPVSYLCKNPSLLDMLCLCAGKREQVLKAS